MTWSTAAGRQNFGSKWFGAFAVSACLAGAFTATSASAEPGKESTPSGAKGTVGGALLGAEAVIAVEAAVGLDKWWMYALGGGLGAIGGGVGGYFIDRSGNAEVSMSLLVGGLVFAVPTTIALLSATAYKPTINPSIDAGATAAERAEDRMHLARYQPVPSFVDVNSLGRVQLRLPAVEIAPVFSQKTRQIYALPDATSVRVPVFHLSF